MIADPQAIANEIAADVLREQIWRAEHAPLPRAPARPARAPADDSDDVLRSIAPPDYVQALAGVEVPVHGMIQCPLPGHEDRTPSFKVYRDPEQGVYCFGCGAGGDIYAFAAALWDMSTRADFPELGRRLAVELLRAYA
jgi:hypothetical protein